MSRVNSVWKLVVSVGLAAPSASAALSAEAVGKYVCTAIDSRFLPGELEKAPRPPSPPQNPADQVYYVTVAPISVADWLSDDCSAAASALVNIPNAAMASHGGLPILKPGADGSGPPVFADEFPLKCLSTLRMDRKSLGTFPITRRYGTSETEFSPINEGRVFFNQIGINGWFLLRADMSFVSEDASWNGGVTIEKGTCSRVEK